MPHTVHLLAILCLAVSGAVRAQSVSACVGSVAMPPFTFFASDGKPVGYAIDLLTQLLKGSGYRIESISVLPTARCHAMVREKKIDLAINVPGMRGDGRSIRLSKSYHKLHPVLLYNSEQHPRGVPVKQLADLQRLRICGLQGVSLDNYGLASSQVDSGAKTYSALLKKLVAKRCDLIIEKREVLGGLYLVAPEAKQILESSAVSFMPLPEQTEVGLHFGVAESAVEPNLLLSHLNAGLGAMMKRNELPSLMQRYMP